MKEGPTKVIIISFLFMFFNESFPKATQRAMGCQAFRLRRRCKVQSSSGVLKEKRARLYIIRRCVLMLICWRDHKDK